MQAEVHPGNQQEHHDNQVDHRAVEMAHAGVVGREAADSDGRKGMTDGIKQIHARQPQQQGAGYGQQQVDVPQGFGRFGNPGRHLVVFHRPGYFGTKQLHAADAKNGQNCHRQHYDAHAAQPLQHLAIEQDRLGQGVQTADHGGACGGETGKGFEEGLGHRHIRLGTEHEGNGPHAAEHRPEQHHDEKAFFGSQLFIMGTIGKPQRQPQDQADNEGAEKIEAGAIAIDVGHQGRSQHGNAEQGNQNAHDADNCAYMHGTSNIQGSADLSRLSFVRAKRVFIAARGVTA